MRHLETFISNPQQAKKYYQEASTIWEAVGTNFGKDLCRSLKSTADALTAAGETAEADKTRRKAQQLEAIAEAKEKLHYFLTTGTDPKSVAFSLTQLANSIEREGTHESRDRAKRWHQLSICILKESFGDDSRELFSSLLAYKDFLQRIGESTWTLDAELKKLKPVENSREASSDDAESKRSASGKQKQKSAEEKGNADEPLNNSTALKPPPEDAIRASGEQPSCCPEFKSADILHR
ncbi:MAG TPA: hypothetical protein V6D17_18935 [Candidatus Obscuribacterales bacterium]